MSLCVAARQAFKQHNISDSSENNRDNFFIKLFLHGFSISRAFKDGEKMSL